MGHQVHSVGSWECMSQAEPCLGTGTVCGTGASTLGINLEFAFACSCILIKKMYEQLAHEMGGPSICWLLVAWGQYVLAGNTDGLAFTACGKDPCWEDQAKLSTVTLIFF